MDELAIIVTPVDRAGITGCVGVVPTGSMPVSSHTLAMVLSM